MAKKRRIVVKVGTSTITQGTKKLSRRYMLELTRQIAHLHSLGHELIVVSSGSIAAGRELLNYPMVDRSLPLKQMFASVGQVKLMEVWSGLFALFELYTGQLLLTRQDFSDRKRYLNARETLSCLLRQRIVPVINENDTIATAEIRVGDNDNLAALVATLVGADLLILLTDQEGLYTADPRSHPDAVLIKYVESIDEAVFKLAGGSISGLGTGGMVTKLEAAQQATRCGTATIIASSAKPNVLIDLACGESIGTFFVPLLSPRKSRQRWLLSEKYQGVIEVDSGAATTLMGRGKSLLPSGITQVVGDFERGAVVQLLSPTRTMIAIGITNYSSQEIQRVQKHHSKEIEKVLGYSYGAEIVHRDNMVCL